MKKHFKPTDICWIKNVSNQSNGEAYMDVQLRTEFHLHFPEGVGGKNIDGPKVGEIILLRQTLESNQKAFTHLVSPTTNETVNDEKADRGYQRARVVKVIAKTRALLVDDTKFKHLYSRGNVCRIKNFKKTQNYTQLQKAIWDAFQLV